MAKKVQKQGFAPANPLVRESKIKKSLAILVIIGIPIGLFFWGYYLGGSYDSGSYNENVCEPCDKRALEEYVEIYNLGYESGKTDNCIERQK